MEAVHHQNMCRIQLHATVYRLECARVAFVLPKVTANQLNSHLIHLQQKCSPRHVQQTSPLLYLQMFQRMSRLTAVVHSARKLFGIHLPVTTTSVAATLAEEEYLTLSLQMEAILMLRAGKYLMSLLTVLVVLCVIQMYATVHLSLRKARRQNHLRRQLRHRLHHQLHILQQNSPFVAALNVRLMYGTRWHVETIWVAVTLVEEESST